MKELLLNNAVFDYKDVEKIIIDYDSQSFGYFYHPSKVLYDKESKYQRITVVEIPDVGNALFLDKAFNLSSTMELFYHEPMAFIPLLFNSNAKNVLIIGGGDLGVARQVLRNEKIQSVTLCELDEEVTNVARVYFPELTVCEKDSRLKIVFSEGVKYLSECNDNTFDAIIVDSTDPHDNAPILISENFYKIASQKLTQNGVVIQNIAGSVCMQEGWSSAYNNSKGHFEFLYPIFLSIPFYTPGDWGVVVLSNHSINLEDYNENTIDFLPPMQTLNLNKLKSLFDMPKYFEDIIKKYSN